MKRVTTVIQQITHNPVCSVGSGRHWSGLTNYTSGFRCDTYNKQTCNIILHNPKSTVSWPSINLQETGCHPVCLPARVSGYKHRGQSCPTEIYLWQRWPIILSLYFGVDTCLFTDTRTITNIASWYLPLIQRGCCVLLHNAHFVQHN